MIVETFAGPGGWDEGLAELGLAVTVGIEHDETACLTRRAAGHQATLGDASGYGPEMFPGMTGFIASPPCQGFSTAGKGAARDLIPELLASIHARRWGDRADPDPRVWLIVDLGRWLEHGDMEWVAMEQVPSVLPIWRAYADLLRSRGYSVWTGVLNSADYGVPQTRERAILMASRVKTVHPPGPTHDRAPADSLFGTLERWVSMADGLGWGMSDRPAFSVAFGTASGGADTSGVGGSGARAALRSRVTSGEDLAPGVVDTGRAWGQCEDGGSQRVDGNVHPAPAVTAKSGGQWVFKPGTAATADFDVDAVRLSVVDALKLQSFRPDFPVQGGKTKQFEQIGNAIPPRLARHILTALI